MIDLLQIRHFVKVAEKGSFSRAAVELKVAQSVLSRQVKKLEDTLGMALFYRDGRGVQLTQAGESLVGNASALMSAMEKMLADIDDLKRNLTGTVVVGMPATIGRILTVPLARHFQSNYPDVRLTVSELFSPQLVEQLRDGRMDAALVYETSGLTPLNVEPVYRDQLVLISPRGLVPGGSGDTIPFKALEGLPLVLPSRTHKLRSIINETAGALGIDLQVELEVDAAQGVLECARSGFAHVVAPMTLLGGQDLQGAVHFRRIVDPEIFLELSLVTGAYRPSALSRPQLAKLLRAQLNLLLGSTVQGRST